MKIVVHRSAGSAPICDRDLAGSKLRSAAVIRALCILSDGIKLQSGGIHYRGCRYLQTCRTQWSG